MYMQGSPRHQSHRCPRPQSQLDIASLHLRAVGSGDGHSDCVVQMSLTARPLESPLITILYFTKYPVKCSACDQLRNEVTNAVASTLTSAFEVSLDNYVVRLCLVLNPDYVLENHRKKAELYCLTVDLGLG